VVLCHESSNSSNRTVLPQTNDLPVALNPVVLQGLKWNSLVLPLGLLWLGVYLLLTLLTATAKTKDEVEGGLLLDVVVGEGAAVLELLSSKDETLLIWWDSFLVLDLGLHVVNGIRWLDIEGDGLTGQGLDEDLHTSTETKDQVEGGLLLDVVIRKGAAVLELLSCKDETLLIWRDSLLVLDLGLDIVDSVGWFDVQGDGLSSQGLDEDLHTSAETKYQVEGGLLLDVVIREGAAIL